mmetsp:Transcript_25203/g.34855  ORF Transcript_25203/g.34855 Transcript_25203/m.34855 type:complete len:140 (-) Transcript_25203:2292-2711(-)
MGVNSSGLLGLVFLFLCSTVAEEEQKLVSFSKFPFSFFFLFNLIFLLQKALGDLYHNTNGPDWVANDGWMSGDPCLNSWFGIECTDDDTILAIELPENNLQGTFSSSIGLFSALEQLDLKGNTIAGEIPTNIVQLSSLL